jgi:hypothetical protein
MDDTLHNKLARGVLSSEERTCLLLLARQALGDALCGKGLTPLDIEDLPPNLRQPGASFVTLLMEGELRGCIGGLEAKLPLAEDVRLHAVSAALEDYRFPPLSPQELVSVTIEISCLSTLQELEYSCPDDLLERLRPLTDGVVLVDGSRRATFLPQVWEKIPEPEKFLSLLCRKMGSAPDLWRHKKMTVLVYQVEQFAERA